MDAAVREAIRQTSSSFGRPWDIDLLPRPGEIPFQMETLARAGHCRFNLRQRRWVNEHDA